MIGNITGQMVIIMSMIAVLTVHVLMRVRTYMYVRNVVTLIVKVTERWDLVTMN